MSNVIAVTGSRGAAWRLRALGGGDREGGTTIGRDDDGLDLSRTGVTGCDWAASCSSATGEHDGEVGSS